MCRKICKYTKKKFLDIASPYYDTSLLKTLMLLKFEIEYILIHIVYNGLLNIEELFDVIVNILLEVIMLAFQNFKITNCPRDDNHMDVSELKLFYGFWISKLLILDTVFFFVAI